MFSRHAGPGQRPGDTKNVKGFIKSIRRAAWRVGQIMLRSAPVVIRCLLYAGVLGVLARAFKMRIRKTGRSSATTTVNYLSLSWT